MRVQIRGARLSGIIGAVILASPALAQPAPDAAPGPQAPAQRAADQLLLRQGVIDTSMGRRGASALSGLGPSPRVRALIQLEGPITPSRRAALREAGVRLEGCIASNTFVAFVGGADVASLDRLPFIRWSGDYSDDLKLDPDLDRRQFQTPARRALEEDGDVALVITLFPDEDSRDLRRWITSPARRGIVHHQTEYAGSTVLHATMPRQALPSLSARRSVQYIEHAPEITDRSNIDASWIVQSNIEDVHPLHDAGLTGAGQIIGILDSIIGGLDLGHCSFRDDINNTPGPGHRKIIAYNTNPGSLTHATHVSATAAGHREPASTDDTRGIAYDALIAYANFPAFEETAIYDALALHHSQGARVHSNSWGDDGAAFYTSLARGFDSFCYDHEDSFVGVAITNGPVPLSSEPALRTPENAKNVLAIGATGYPNESPNEHQVGSGGAGPTTDGRRKPEIFAPGFGTTSALNNTVCSITARTGTSMACPAVTGSAVLIRQYFTDGYYPTGAAVPMDGFIPTAALIKAMIINGAVDMTGVPGYPSDHEGWGRLLADNALSFAGETRTLIVEDTWNAVGLATGEVAPLGVTVNSPGETLRITLAWTEPPAAPGAFEVQVNDLNLEVIAPNGDVYRGNVFLGGGSVPGGAPDDRNNVEQVIVSAPQTGNWTVRVKGAAINVGAQGYALTITGDVQDSPSPLSVGLAPAPALNPTGSPVPIVATIASGSDVLVPDSAVLMIRDPGEQAFTPVALSDQGGGVFLAHLPIVFCGDSVEYYVQAAGSTTGIVTDPPEGASAPLSATMGAVSPLFFDDFESDLGWTSSSQEDTATTGAWERVDPNPTTAVPDDDHTPVGTMAWVTQQAPFPNATAANSDVDGGFVTLTSPSFDLSSNPEARISFWRWFYSTHSSPQDTFRVDVSPDGGSTWANAVTWGMPTRFQTLGGWISHEFRLADVIAPSGSVRVRFRVEDAAGGSTVEGALDDFAITDVQCVDAYCFGDANGDTLINFADITSVLGNWLETSAPGSGDPGDADHDGFVQFADITAILQSWQTGCP